MIRTALRLIGPDPANWIPDRPGIDHKVAIVGGGQTGCALAFPLRRAGVGKVTILEAASNEQRAGIRLNAARINMLRGELSRDMNQRHDHRSFNRRRRFLGVASPRFHAAVTR
jgi:2-polyprenyl-6-methoxyphenol hydroxylase-like FAD-dependent oxidoreductase